MTEPRFTFTIPPVACLFGEREHVDALFAVVYGSKFVRADLQGAADNAARAIVGRQPSGYLTFELGTPEHQKARADLHAYLMTTSPEIVAAAMWSAVEREQANTAERHRYTQVQNEKVGGKVEPFVPLLLVFHLDSEAEFVLVQQLAPAAIAVEVVARQPVSEATQVREGWPVRCTRIGARPDCPAWVSDDAHEYFGAWAKLARQRVLSLARANLAGGIAPL